MSKMKREKREAKGWNLPDIQDLQRKMEDPDDSTVMGASGFVGSVPHMRPSLSMEKYAEDDGRLDPSDCEHTQFLDVSFPVREVWCLDCGSRVRAGSWEVVTPEELSDAQLQEKRDFFNEFWGLK